MEIPNMTIGNLTFKLPIIQGGMGIGVSRSSLASAVTNSGGLGVISGAQIGFDRDGFDSSPLSTNIEALKEEITRAKKNSNQGFIGVNLMVAMKNYAEMVKAAVEAKADVIISGAGLPINLPELVKNSSTKIIPIVSSMKAAKLITTMWEKKHNKIPDAIIVEGPEAGGHLGFKADELESKSYKTLEEIVVEIIDYMRTNNYSIPIIAAGGIYNGYDVAKFLKLGAAGVQMSTRLVPTVECDASDEFKNAYINSTKEDIVITKSPVGLPGRALNNNFIKTIHDNRKEITRCYNCLEHCNPKETPYCITMALINSVKGNLDDGLIFVGSNAYKCDKIDTVKNIFEEIEKEIGLA